MKTYFIVTSLSSDTVRCFLHVSRDHGPVMLMADHGLQPATLFDTQSLAQSYVDELRHREAVRCTILPIEFPFAP
jgi:hypothetical protein